MCALSEAEVERAALDWLVGLGWTTARGPDISPGGSGPERTDYGTVVLEGRLRGSLARHNPGAVPEALEDAYRRVTRPEGSTLGARNRAFHRMLTEGVTVEHRTAGGAVRGAQVNVIDFEDAGANDWLAVNQFTVSEHKRTRRADIVLFVNGLPLGVIELKNPADEDADVWAAWRQLQTYKAELPTLFAMNELLVVSDGLEARLGTLTAGREWFKPWRRFGGDDGTSTGDGTRTGGGTRPSALDAGGGAAEVGLQVLLEEVCEPGRLLALIRDFVVFDDDGGGPLVKKMAGYHQFHAVRTAVSETLRAARLQQSAPGGPAPTRPDSPAPDPAGHDAGGRPCDTANGDDEAQRTRAAASRSTTRRTADRRPGDRRVGVVWHTQGAGKSLTMAFYAGAIIRERAMGNPTVVVLTDRNDLDDQLFGTFSRCGDLLRQTPAQAESRADLRQKLSVNSGGVVFTTIQKFFPAERGDTHPALSDRRNIVVIADEAHRSQYDFIDGFAKHMRDALPNASFVGFTGTPVELRDANTRAVFGDYISIYDIQRSVEDGATVPIYYESRLAQLSLDESLQPYLDDRFEEATEGEEVERKERLKTRWAQLEAIVGTERRIRQVAEDIVEHYAQRLEVLDGKAMVVCMSRRICVDLHTELVRLRPDWEHADDESGGIKVVMTGSASDPADWQPHIRNKARREALARRFRDAEDPLRIVIVRDMWLTGFDAPSLHTMYVDKPMRGHGLMQAIARVNRVFKDKPGGLVVDYLGLAHELKRALATYTREGGTGSAAIDQDEAVAVMQERYEICCDLLGGFDWSNWATGSPTERLGLLPPAQEHLLAQENGKDRFLAHVRALEQAFALAVPHDSALAIRDDVAFFQAVRSALVKRTVGEARTDEELDHAIRQIIAGAVAPEGVVDIFAAAGLDKPDISILSDEFLAEVRGMPHRNLAVELLQKLLKSELSARRRTNVVQARSFSEMLEQSLRRYQNRAIEAAQVIEELIKLARDMREAAARGEQLGLSDEELAFYDALGANDSAVSVLGDDTLRDIARELVETVRANVTIDWTVRESVRAKLRVLVRRTLNRHRYPPDKQEQATLTVIEQAEALSERWAA